MLKWLWLSLLVILADQFSKQAALQSLIQYEPVALLPYFNLSLTFNEGAAFSFLSQAGGWQRWFLSVLAIAISVFILVWLKTLDAGEKLLACGLALVLGGAIGNVIDRIVLGKVTDFIDWYYPSGDSCLPFFYRLNEATCHWPTFNLADSAIFLGVVLVLSQTLFQKPPA